MPPDNERYNRIVQSLSDAAEAEQVAAADMDRFNRATQQKPGFGRGLVAGIPFVGDRPDQDSTLGYRQGHMVTESILTGLPIGKGLSMLRPLTQPIPFRWLGPEGQAYFDVASRGRKLAESIRSSIAGSYKAGKLRFAGTEGLIGYGAGTAGHYAVQNFPDSGVAQFVAELGGGLATDVARQGVMWGARGVLNISPTVVGLRWGDRRFGERLGRKPSEIIREGYNSLRRGMDPSFASGRARERFERQGITETRARDIIADAESVSASSDEFLPGSVEQMSFAQRAGDVGLLQLEKDVMEMATDDALSLGTTQRIQELNDILVRGFELGDPSTFNPTQFRQYMETKREYYQALLDASLENAARDTDSRLARHGVSAGQEEQANLIARSALDKALKGARDTETELWKAIPKDITIPSDNFAKLWLKLRSTMTNVAQQTDSPVTTSWLNKIRFGKKKGQPRIGEMVTIQQARDLISQLRREARNATSAFGETNFNLARIANDLATAINDDLGESIVGLYGSADGPGNEIVAAMEEAVVFSRGLNETFRNPAIAGLFAKDAAGNPLIRNTEVLDHLFASPSKNRGNYDDLMNAVGGDPAVEQALNDYLRFSLFNHGDFDIPAAKNFLQVNERLLDRMPALRKDVMDAVELNDIGLLRQESLKADFEPLLAAATVFIQKTPNKAFNEILDSPNPTRGMAEIVRLAKEDDTGAALAGLQQGLSEYLLNIATKNSEFVSTGGNRFVDYNLLEETLNKDSIKGLLPMVFDEAQVNRLNQIRASARRLQMQRDVPARGSVEGIQKDLASKILIVAARLGGARLGGGPISGMSVGGSLQSASIVSNWLRSMVAAGIENPSENLIQMAVLDENLFKALYRTPRDEAGARAAEETVSAAVRYLTRGIGSKAASTETLLVEPLVEPFTEERDRRSGAIQNQ